MLAPAVFERNALAQLRSGVKRFAPTTTERYAFDDYCSMQVFLVLEPAASGAMFWDMPPKKTTSLEPISGALLLDSNQLFKFPSQENWNTSLQSLTITNQNTRFEGGSYGGWSKFFDYFSELIATTAASMTQLVNTPPGVVLHEPAVPELTTPYANLLNDLHDTSPWRSWKKLKPLLGTSHTQLQRIANGTVKVPQADLATRIDELYSFAKRLTSVSGGDVTATTRLLTTRRPRDRKSANDFLIEHDYKSAFRAVMDAASPRKTLPTIDAVPRRWYDEPSVDIYDDGIEPDG